MAEKISHFKRNWKNYLIGFLILIVVLPMLGALFLIASEFTSYNSVGSMSSKMGYKSNDMMYESAGSSYYSPSYNDGFAPEVEERQVIRNGNVNLVTESYDLAKLNIENSIAKYDGIILNNNEQKYKDKYRTVYYNLKIDSTKLDTFLEEVKLQGEVESINVYSNDVTGTYVDYQERIVRYKEQIVKYEAKLKSDKITITEEIQIQDRIDNLEDQIFYLEGRLDNIDEKVSYSSVTINLKEKESVLSEVDFLGFKDGFKLFLNSLQSGVVVILAILGFVIPFGIIYGIVRFIRK